MIYWFFDWLIECTWSGRTSSAGKVLLNCSKRTLRGDESVPVKLPEFSLSILSCTQDPFISAKDPFNFDADPDPGSALEKKGYESKSGSGLRFIYLIHFAYFYAKN